MALATALFSDLANGYLMQTSVPLNRLAATHSSFSTPRLDQKAPRSPQSKFEVARGPSRQQPAHTAPSNARLERHGRHGLAEMVLSSTVLGVLAAEILIPRRAKKTTTTRRWNEMAPLGSTIWGPGRNLNCRHAGRMSGVSKRSGAGLVSLLRLHGRNETVKLLQCNC